MVGGADGASHSLRGARAPVDDCQNHRVELGGQPGVEGELLVYPGVAGLAAEVGAQHDHGVAQPRDRVVGVQDVRDESVLATFGDQLRGLCVGRTVCGCRRHLVALTQEFDDGVVHVPHQRPEHP